MQSKSSNVFANSDSIAFTGKLDAFVRTAKKVKIQRVPGFARLRQASSRVLNHASTVIRNYSDDAIKSKSAKNLFKPIIKSVKRVVGYCATAVTGAIVYVSNLGDDIKARVRANFKPVSLVKDIVSKSKERVIKMNRADFAALERMDGPGVVDVAQKAVEGAAKATNFDINGSIKKLASHLFAKN